MNAVVLHRFSIKMLVGIAFVVLVYISTSFAFLLLVAVLIFFYHDQGNARALPLYQAPDITDELRFFLQYNFLYWLEAHSCMQTQRDGPGTMLPLFLEWAMLSRSWYRFIDGLLMLFTVYRR